MDGGLESSPIVCSLAPTLQASGVLSGSQDTAGVLGSMPWCSCLSTVGHRNKEVSMLGLGAPCVGSYRPFLPWELPVPVCHRQASFLP